MPDTVPHPEDTPRLELGLGLIGIGRPWPRDEDAVCSVEQAWTLLDQAIGLGIRFFDTAAAYGSSERVLGEYLRTIPGEQRAELLIATKCGEVWPKAEADAVDHSIGALEASFDRSAGLLGRIDLLQLHKCTVDDMRDDSLLAWFTSLRAAGRVGAIGVSVSTPEALRAAVATEVFDTVQFPANQSGTVLSEAYAQESTGCLPLLNRPMASGALADSPNPFRFHADTFRRGVVLTGTTNTVHLARNKALFDEAVAAVPSPKEF
ncbi:aldo/keto reductase [Streptomyces sp. NPDC090445]|uniref:aldo/keto reductase n=1 Tax=Streptomyces sp. NPDC090445 TaxID=3365963 RepID=UPI003828FCBC